jgi:hypothetical protein
MVIVLRVAAGKAWSKETVLSTLRIAAAAGSPEESNETLNFRKSHVENCEHVDV